MAPTALPMGFGLAVGLKWSMPVRSVWISAGASCCTARPITSCPATCSDTRPCAPIQNRCRGGEGVNGPGEITVLLPGRNHPRADVQRVALGGFQFRKLAQRGGVIEVEEHQRVAMRPRQAGADVRGRQGFQLMFRIADVGDGIQHLALDPAIGTGAQSVDQRLLAGEVAIRRGVAQVHAVGQAPEAQRFQAIGLEYRHGDIKDLVALARAHFVREFLSGHELS